MAAVYDVNFCLPVRELENEKILLTPFIPSLHSEAFVEASHDYPEIYNHYPIGPFETVHDFNESFSHNIAQPDPNFLCFAILDKTKSTSDETLRNYALAGLISFMNTSVANSCTEIGFILILPPFQKTHVTSNAVGLMLHYSLDPPNEPPQLRFGAGLGLLRVVWQTSSRNIASIKAGKRMGFQFEAVKRWDRMWPTHRANNGIMVPAERGAGAGRDTVLLAFGWDTWVEGGREKVRALMDRRI